ncbi:MULTISPECIES: hypothetical protein [Methylotenera]|uniref:hypothetical protein n=1 Tax=Methylotenera TaxID=359407 RepID=UPI00036A91F9|nr:MULTISPECIES: hypothetical protein [Methylotenera]
MSYISRILIASSLFAASSLAFSAEVCKVSMMGRVCFEEGSAEATAAHMKGDAVGEVSKKKKLEASAEIDTAKKVAVNTK